MPERVPSLELEEEEEIGPEYEQKEHKGVEKVDAIIFAKPGEIYKAKVIEILKGRMADFIDIEAIEDETLKERLMRIMDDPAFKVRFLIPELGYEGSYVVRVSLHENSKYVELSRCYGSIKVGDTVWVELRQNGRPRIVCPPREIG